jgi:ABC-type sugar transport system ATPase subunit
LTIRENIILALQARYGWFKFLSPERQSEIAQKYIQLLGIVTPSAEQLASNLSWREPAKAHPGSLACHQSTGIDPG